MSAQPFIERRSRQRLAPAPADAVITGDSALIVAPWNSWVDAEAARRWDVLARDASTPNPFFESWYLLPALRRFDPAGTIRIARLERGGELIGLMPLAPSWRYGRWPLPHLANWLHPNCFLGAPLVARGSEPSFWRALLAWADANAGPSLFLHLALQPLDNGLTGSLYAIGAEQGRRIALVHREERALLCSRLAPDDYLRRAVPGKKRKEYRRQQTRLSELGALEFHREDGIERIASWVEQFLKLEAEGWKGRSGSALACAPQTELLFREAMNDAAHRGLLERLSFTLDGQPIAMLANFLTAPGAFSFKTAFDERYARFSPGVLLQLENLAMLEREEIAWCDSCAAADHPMIDSLWMERRSIGRISIAIGGTTRRAAFERLVAMELNRNPAGIIP